MAVSRTSNRDVGCVKQPHSGRHVCEGIVPVHVETDRVSEDSVPSRSGVVKVNLLAVIPGYQVAFADGRAADRVARAARHVHTGDILNCRRPGCIGADEVSRDHVPGGACPFDLYTGCRCIAGNDISGGRGGPANGVIGDVIYAETAGSVAGRRGPVRSQAQVIAFNGVVIALQFDAVTEPTDSQPANSAVPRGD